MDYAWFELSPHSVWVTAFLSDGKLFNYNIGQLPKTSFTVALGTPLADKVMSCTTETKEFIVNSTKEHNDVFELLAFDWLDTFEKDDCLDYHLEVICRRNANKIIEILKVEIASKSLINGIPTVYEVSLMNDMLEYITENKDTPFLCNNGFMQLKNKYVVALENSVFTDDLTEIQPSTTSIDELSYKINHFKRVFKMLESKIK